MPDTELKSCPCCGEKVYIVYSKENGGYRATIYCMAGTDTGCFLKMSHWALRKRWAIESVTTAWNRRAVGKA